MITSWTFSSFNKGWNKLVNPEKGENLFYTLFFFRQEIKPSSSDSQTITLLLNYITWHINSILDIYKYVWALELNYIGHLCNTVNATISCLKTGALFITYLRVQCVISPTVLLQNTAGPLILGPRTVNIWETHLCLFPPPIQNTFSVTVAAASASTASTAYLKQRNKALVCGNW